MRVEGVDKQNRHRKELLGVSCKAAILRRELRMRNAHVALAMVHTKRCGEVLHAGSCTQFPVPSLPFRVQSGTQLTPPPRWSRSSQDLQTVVLLTCVAERDHPLWSHCDARACFRSWNRSPAEARKVHAIDPAASSRDPCFGRAQNFILGILGSAVRMRWLLSNKAIEEFH
jgi:hypothetical protein